MGKILDRLKGLFRWQNLVKPALICGPMPANKEILGKTFRIAWPSAMESILIALIGAVDMIMVGGLGKEAVSAVGITTQPKFIVLAVVLSLNVALTVLVSRRKGENNPAAANKYLRQSLMLSIGLAFALSILGIVFAKDFMVLAGANSDYIELSVQYFRIIMIGNFFYCISLTITAAQRGAGNTKISMITNLAANVVNLCFNAFLINGLFFFPKLGVQGAAIATAIGNIVALLMAIYSVSKKSSFLKLNFKDNWKFDKNTLSDLYRIASSTFVEQIFMRIGFFMYSKAVASLGTTSFSAHQVCMNVMHITFACGDGLQIASTTLVGQSLGAKRPDLAMVYSRIAQRSGVIIGIVLCILIAFGRDALMLIFIQDADVILAGELPMIFLSITVLFQVPQVIAVGSLRGAGDVKFVALLMLISVAIVRPGLAWFLAHGLEIGLVGAWMALLMDQIIRYFVSSYRFKQAKWTKIEV